MSKLKELVRSYSFAIYPVLFGLFPLLSFYGANAAEIAVGGFRISTFLFFNLIVAGVAWGVAALLTRNQHKSGILASVIILLFFTFGRIHNALPEISINTPVMLIGPSKILLLLSLLIVAGVWFGLRKLTNEKAEKVSGTLLLVSGVLVATSLISVFMGASSGGSSASSNRTGAPANQSTNASLGTEQGRPDIYYILLDGYTREDMLKANFGFDNSPFINALEKRGFYVADKANSNYAHTHFSVPSTFNLQHEILKLPGRSSG